MGRRAHAKATRSAAEPARITVVAVASSDADAINYANAGLMVLSALLAFRIPFHLFLFAYAVLGPLHYFTEISWLHDRGYFTKHTESRRLWLAIVAVCMTALTWCLYDSGPHRLITPPWEASLVYVAFFTAIAAVSFASPRLMAVLVAVVIAVVPFI
jgi:hypothetical protein